MKINLNNIKTVEFTGDNLQDIILQVHEIIDGNSEHFYIESNTIETKFHRNELTDEEILKGVSQFILSLPETKAEKVVKAKKTRTTKKK